MEVDCLRREGLPLAAGQQKSEGERYFKEDRLRTPHPVATSI
ncbi:hypothetical protein [Halobacillus campisalis]|uniref:Uncharacterized protein n=1 Tax=Halobacillus campisalis TaxID=435909 RepID=A0ABW2JZP5_9BACI|nr:hypothetical protein [Halobacillus campisalis]